MKSFQYIFFFFYYYFRTESYRIINTSTRFKIYTKILFREQIFQKELNFY